jgi:AraC-like DNA-binding protein
MTRNLIIRAAHRTFCSPDWRWESRLQSGETRLGFNLWYVAKGKGSLKTVEGRFELKHGDCFLLRSSEEHLGTADPNDPTVVLWCSFDYIDSDGGRFPLDETALPRRYRAVSNTVFFESLMARLIEAFGEDPKSDRAIRWLESALDEVEREDRLTKMMRGVDRDHAEIIDRICRDIRENPGRRFKASKLASKSSMCVDHFIRVFRRHTGITPGEYMINNRIDAARGLLRSSSHSIGRIAEILGYSNVYAFSQQFNVSFPIFSTRNPRRPLFCGVVPACSPAF